MSNHSALVRKHCYGKPRDARLHHTVRIAGRHAARGPSLSNQFSGENGESIGFDLETRPFSERALVFEERPRTRMHIDVRNVRRRAGKRFDVLPVLGESVVFGHLLEIIDD